MPIAEPQETVEREYTPENRNNIVEEAIKEAKAKNARLRLMKERNENYLAERREELAEEEEELRESHHR